MTTIRRASDMDAPALLALLIRLAEHSAYTGGHVIDVPHTAQTLAVLLARPEAGFFVAEREEAMVGLLAVLLHEELLAPDLSMAQICWYVDEAHRDGLGLLLLEAAEQWAVAQGACKAEMLAPEAKFERYLLRRGYVAGSRVCERRLRCRG